MTIAIVILCGYLKRKSLDTRRWRIPLWLMGYIDVVHRHILFLSIFMLMLLLFLLLMLLAAVLQIIPNWLLAWPYLHYLSLCSIEMSSNVSITSVGAYHIIVIVYCLIGWFDGSFVVLTQPRFLPFDPVIQFIIFHWGLYKFLLPSIEHPLQLVLPQLCLRGQVRCSLHGYGSAGLRDFSDVGRWKGTQWRLTYARDWRGRLNCRWIELMACFGYVWQFGQHYYNINQPIT